MSKIALITGANRGLGRASALALAEADVDLIITYRSNADEAASVVDEAVKLGRTAVAFQLDVGKLEQFDAFTSSVSAALAENWGRDSFDYLVNNAGVGLGGSIADTTVEAFDELLNVHFRGVFFLTQKLLPLIADHDGKIINLSTGLARFTGDGGYSAYASMKGAIEVFTRYLAKEVGPRGITANVVAPGATGTDFGGGMMRDNEQVRAYLSSQNVMGRMGRPEDIGGLIATLLTGETSWVTAQRIEVSGGMLI
jgi:NAD(P)-dependent dehydrogenase (short-subunit alcohol dehydrogenase family)